MHRSTRAFAVLSALLLALAVLPLGAAAKGPSPVEGTDFVAIEGGIPYAPVAGTVEVAEVFGYTCPACARFEPQLAAWRRTLPAKARFVAVPAAFGGYWVPYARAYLAAQALGVAERSHGAMFRAIHEEKRLPVSNAGASEIATFYADYGIQPARFVAAYQAPSIDAQLARSREFITRAQVDGTPAIVVAGRYRVTGRNAADTLRIARWLVDRELAARR